MIQPDPFRFTNWCEQHGDVNQDVKRVTNIYTLLPVWSSYMTNLLKLVHRKLKNILRKKKNTVNLPWFTTKFQLLSHGQFYFVYILPPQPLEFFEAKLKLHNFLRILFCDCWKGGNSFFCWENISQGLQTTILVTTWKLLVSSHAEQNRLYNNLQCPIWPGPWMSLTLSNTLSKHPFSFNCTAAYWTYSRYFRFRGHYCLRYLPWVMYLDLSLKSLIQQIFTKRLSIYLALL